MNQIDISFFTVADGKELHRIAPGSLKGLF
jgi:hypothetical protein